MKSRLSYKFIGKIRYRICRAYNVPVQCSTYYTLTYIEIIHNIMYVQYYTRIMYTYRIRILPLYSFVYCIYVKKNRVIMHFSFILFLFLSSFYILFIYYINLKVERFMVFYFFFFFKNEQQI